MQLLGTIKLTGFLNHCTAAICILELLFQMYFPCQGQEL